MSKEQMEQIIDEVYDFYCKSFDNQCLIESYSFDTDPMTKVMFVGKIKNLDWFSQDWGLKIEERELSLEERYKLANINGRKERLPGDPYYTDEQQHSLLDELVPTKLITLTYKNEKIECYG